MRASAPASSGNLGPGFDVLGLALALRCVVEAEPSGRTTVDDGDGPVELGPGDLLFDVVEEAVGRPMALRVANEIPRTRGLGSSAAVSAAAAAAAIRATGAEAERNRVYEIVAGAEGHGDNAAPAVWGGLMAVGADGPHRLDISDELIPVAGIPDRPLSTKHARTVLPERVTLASATRNTARTVLLVEGLRTGDAATLAAAAGDEFHERQRAALSPITGRLMEAARGAGALHVAWSGAGPTALAFAAAGSEHAVVAAMTAAMGDAGTVRILSVDDDGLR